jgi:hypothetical protein
VPDHHPGAQAEPEVPSAVAVSAFCAWCLQCHTVQYRHPIPVTVAPTERLMRFTASMPEFMHEIADRLCSRLYSGGGP